MILTIRYIGRLMTENSSKNKITQKKRIMMYAPPHFQRIYLSATASAPAEQPSEAPAGVPRWNTGCAQIIQIIPLNRRRCRNSAVPAITPCPVSLSRSRRIHPSFTVKTENILKRKKDISGNRTHRQADKIPVDSFCRRSLNSSRTLS